MLKPFVLLGQKTSGAYPGAAPHSGVRPMRSQLYTATNGRHLLGKKSSQTTCHVTRQCRIPELFARKKHTPTATHGTPGGSADLATTSSHCPNPNPVVVDFSSDSMSNHGITYQRPRCLISSAISSAPNRHQQQLVCQYIYIYMHMCVCVRLSALNDIM